MDNATRLVRFEALKAGLSYDGNARGVVKASEVYAETLPAERRMLAMTSFRAATANRAWAKALVRKMAREF